MIIEALQIPLSAMVLNIADPVRCIAPDSPYINVRPVATPIQYNRRYTMEELTAKGSDTISPYPRHAVTLVGGTTHSEIKVKTETKFEIQSFPALGLACVYYDRIDVTLELNATIYIARDHHKRSCKYEEILAHEKKHVRTDKQVLNDYSHVIGKALERAINHSMARGPYPIGRLEDITQSMSEYVGSVLATQQSLMEEDRFRRQQGIDSLEEYERIRQACD